MEKTSKGAIHIFLLLVVVVIGVAGIGYYAFKNDQIKTTPQLSPTPTTFPDTPTTFPDTPTPTPDPTADLKAYINKEYGFSFKYPGSLIAEDVSGSANEPIIILYLIDPLTAPTELIDNILVSHSVDLPTANYNETEISSLPAYVTTDPVGKFNSLRTFIKISSNSYIKFELTPYNETIDLENQENYKQTYDQILSTFEFIEN